MGKVTLATEFTGRPVKPELRPEEPAGQDRWPPPGPRVQPSHRAHHLSLSSQQQTALRKKKKILFGRAKLAVSPGRKATRPHWGGWVAAWAPHRGLVGRWQSCLSSLGSCLAKPRRQPCIPRILGSSLLSCSTASFISSQARLLLRNKCAMHSHAYTSSPALPSHHRQSEDGSLLQLMYHLPSMPWILHP